MNHRVVDEISRRHSLEKERALRLRNWEQGGTAGPFKLMYFPTNSCNMQCAICWQRKGVHDYSELPAARQIALISEAIELGVREFVIGGGGEPLLRWENLRPLFEKICAVGGYGMIFTNGTLISPDVAASLVDMKWNKVLISLDGLKESNDIVRQVGSFDEITQGLRCLLETRGDKPLPIVGVGCVMAKQTIRELPGLVDYLGSLGCEQLNLIRLVVYSDSQRNFALTSTEVSDLQSILESASKKAESYGMVTNINEYMDKDLVTQTESFDNVLLSDKTKATEECSFWNALCFEPFSNIVVYADGTVGPCCMSGDAHVASLAGRTLADVWYGDEFSDIRRGLLSRQPEFYCRICDVNVFAENQRLRNLGRSA